MTKASDIRKQLATLVEPYKGKEGSEALLGAYKNIHDHLWTQYPVIGQGIDPQAGDPELVKLIDAMLKSIDVMQKMVTAPVPEKNTSSDSGRKAKALEMFELAQSISVLPEYLSALRKEAYTEQLRRQSADELFGESNKKPESAPSARKQTLYSSGDEISKATDEAVALAIAEAKKNLERQSITLKGNLDDLAGQLKRDKKNNNQGFYEQRELELAELERKIVYMSLMIDFDANIAGARLLGKNAIAAAVKERDEVRTLLANPSKNNIKNLEVKGLNKGLVENFFAAEANVQSHGGARLLSNTSANTTKTPAAEQEKRSRFSRMMSRAKRDNTDPAPEPERPDDKKRHRLSWGKNK